MRRLLPVALIVLISCLHAGAQDAFYRSNETGMLLARLPPALRDDPRWVVRVRRTPNGEDRRLYDNGKEVRAWQTAWTPGRAERVERETSQGLLVARRVYDPVGTLLQEEQYSGGALTMKILYSYAGGRLSRKRELGPDGTERALESYVYADNGALREVRHRAREGPSSSAAFVAGPGGLLEQRTRLEETSFVERYDPEGRIANREKRAADGLVSTEDFSYDQKTGALASSRESRPAANTVIDRRYDEAGRLIAESTRVKGAVTDDVSLQRDDKGRITARTRSRGPSALEQWKYSYVDSDDPVREEYYVRSVLVKVTLHGESRQRTEELYRGGELFLKAFYDGDTKVREEVWTAGVKVRERKLQ